MKQYLVLVTRCCCSCCYFLLFKISYFSILVVIFVVLLLLVVVAGITLSSKLLSFLRRMANTTEKPETATTPIHSRLKVKRLGGWLIARDLQLCSSSMWTNTFVAASQVQAPQCNSSSHPSQVCNKNGTQAVKAKRRHGPAVNEHPAIVLSHSKPILLLSHQCCRLCSSCFPSPVWP